MSKFNKTNKPVTVDNLAGGQAFLESPELGFISLLLTSFVKNQFYRTEDETLQEVKVRMHDIKDKEFLAKSAIYARTKYGMRSISHVVASELAQYISGTQWAKRFYEKIVYRPDDMMEIMSYYFMMNKDQKLPRSMIKGFAKAFNKFNGYQLAKYRGDKKGISLVDVVNLVHPKPVETNKEALKKLVADTLRSTDTWETKISASGKAETEEEKMTLKGEAWKELILEKKIGYFALLRNLRNILDQSPDVIDSALELLVNEQAIKKSLVLPFRFTTAMNEIKDTTFPGTRKTMVALNKAVDISLSNVPQFEGKTLVVVDVSGSMSGKPIEIASLFGSILYKANNADLMAFATYAGYVNANPQDTTFTIAEQIKNVDQGGGTDFHNIFIQANKAYERIIILSDMQGWIGYDTPHRAFNEYKQKYNANPFVYSFDLAGYGTLQFPEPKVACLAGFSDKVFDVMKFLEEDKQALIRTIKSVEL